MPSRPPLPTTSTLARSPPRASRACPCSAQRSSLPATPRSASASTAVLPSAACQRNPRAFSASFSAVLAGSRRSATPLATIRPPSIDHRQRLQLQPLVLQLQCRWQDRQREIAALQLALQPRVAAGAAGLELEAQRHACSAAGQQVDVECVAAGIQLPARRVRVAVQGQGGAQRRGRATGDRHHHPRQVAARHQPQPRRGLPGRRRQHRGGQQVAAVVVARRVVAVQGEAAAVAVHRQSLDVQAAAARIQAAARALDVDQRLAFLQHAQAVDADGVGAQVQRRRDGRQHVRPGRQLERGVAARQVERRAAHVQRVQPQGAAEQRADRRVEHERCAR